MAPKLRAHELATFFFTVGTRNFAKKCFFWVKHSVPENFQQKILSGLQPKEPLRTQDSENVVGLGDRASVSKLQRLKVRS